MITKEELLAKAKKPAADAMELHPFYRGKVEMTAKCAIRSFDGFAIWYTPGVATPCKAIEKDPELVYQHTNKWNTVAVISDGTRVLGLGDIGPKAGLPVMEGKALLYKYLGGVDGVAIMLDSKDPDVIINTVKLLQPAFGGVNLEDISQPKCFRILDTLREQCEIPISKDAIVFLCANPIPEMWPWDAKEAGAVVAATGRSDFPNKSTTHLAFLASSAARSMCAPRPSPTRCASWQL